MSASATAEPEEAEGAPLARIETSGQMARSMMHLLSAFVSEARINLLESGISVTAVDSANVGMIELDVDGEAFESYEASGETVAWRTPSVIDALKTARVGRSASSNGDPVTITVEENKTAFLTDRGIFEREAVRYNLPLDSVREEPDLPGLDEWLHWRGRIKNLSGIRSFQEVLDEVGKRTDMFAIGLEPSGNSADLLISADEVEIKAEGEAEDAGSDLIRIRECVNAYGKKVGELGGPKPMMETFSDDRSLIDPAYLREAVEAIKLAKMERLIIGFGDAHPIEILFSNSEMGIEGKFLIAPKIEDDDEAEEDADG